MLPRDRFEKQVKTVLSARKSELPFDL